MPSLINDNDLKETIGMTIPGENNTYGPNILSHHLGEEFSKFIIPGTEKYTYGPDEDGTYDVEVQLAIPRHYFPDLETATLETRKQLAFNDNQGPGQRYAKGTVYAIKLNIKYYILGFSVHGGYDI